MVVVGIGGENRGTFAGDEKVGDEMLLMWHKKVI
jgi:hypothetical protein